MNLIVRSPRLHFKSLYPAVPNGIAESFLQHTEEAKRNVGRQIAWQIMHFAADLHPLLLSVFPAKSFHRYSRAQKLQLR